MRWAGLLLGALASMAMAADGVDTAVNGLQRGLEAALVEARPQLEAILAARQRHALARIQGLAAAASADDAPAAAAALRMAGAATTAATSLPELCRAAPDLAGRLHALVFPPPGWPELAVQGGGPLGSYHRRREALTLALGEAVRQAPADDPTAMPLLAAFAPRDPLVLAWRRTDPERAGMLGRWIDPLQAFEMEHGVAGVDLASWLPAVGGPPMPMSQGQRWTEPTRWDLPEAATGVRIEALLAPPVQGLLALTDGSGNDLLRVTVDVQAHAGRLQVIRPGAAANDVPVPGARSLALVLEASAGGLSARCWDLPLAPVAPAASVAALRADGPDLTAQVLRLRYLAAPVGLRAMPPMAATDF